MSHDAARAKRAPSRAPSNSASSRPKRQAAPQRSAPRTPSPAPKPHPRPRQPAVAVETAEREAAADVSSGAVATSDAMVDKHDASATVDDDAVSNEAGADDSADIEYGNDVGLDDELTTGETDDEGEDEVSGANDEDQAADDEDDTADYNIDDTDEANRPGDNDGAAPDGPDEPDYYATLGVEPTATHDELRQAYRRLAKLWHPDRYVNAPPQLHAQAERRMRALTAAYSVVGDAIRRHLYDQRRAELAAMASAGDEGARRPSGVSGGYRNGHRATVTADYTGYSAWSGASQGGQPDHASENPNGAGIFFGALALVVGLGLFVGASQSGSAWALAVGGVVLVGLIALALVFSNQDSSLAHAAHRLMEGEPRGFADPYVVSGAAGWRASRYADRPPRRATGARKGATTRKGARSPMRDQAPPSATSDPARDTSRPEPPHTDEASSTPPDEPQATTDATSVAASATAQPPETTEEAEAFARFERYVVEAVEALPAEFRAQMGNMVVRVADEPDAATLRKMSVGKGHTLFGLYEGVPLTKQGALAPPPEIVTIYRGPITRACQGDPARIREQARRTVFHEVAHHFGIDHDEMPAWVK